MPISITQSHWKLLAFGWFIFTTILLVIPGNVLPRTRLIQIPYFDKYIHVLLFAVLAFFTLKAVRQFSKAVIIKWVLILSLYGVLMEFVQLYLVPYRSFDGRDIVADTAGVLIGLWICFKVPSSSVRGNGHSI